MPYIETRPAAAPLMRVTRAIGQFRLHDARRAGADEYADAAPAPSRGRGYRTASKKAILPQGKLGQPIVAAIEYLQLCRQALRIDARDLADVGVDLDGLEVARFSPLRCSSRLASFGASPVPMQLVAVNVASSKRFHGLIAARSAT